MKTLHLGGNNVLHSNKSIAELSGIWVQHDNKVTSVKEQSIKEAATFIEAGTFSGSKKGYVYKMDSQGLGYYLDKQVIINN